MNNADHVIETEVGLSVVESSNEFVDKLDHELREFTGHKKASSTIINSIENFINDSSNALTVDEKWAAVIDVVLRHVILEPYIHLDFAVSTLAHFLHEKTFKLAITRRLEREIAEYMLLTLNDEEDNGDVDQLDNEAIDDRSKIRNFCQLISRLLITSWPSEHNRGYGRQRNALTHAGVTAVHTWLDCIEKTTKNKVANEDDLEALKVCAYCIIQLVKNTGRKLWLVWPDLVDRIYSVIKLVIISNDRLVPEKLKERLLSTYVQVNDLPKSTKTVVKTRDAYSQTNQNHTKKSAGSSVFNFSDFSKMLPETSYHHRNGSYSDREKNYFRSPGSTYYRRYGN